MQIPEAAKGKEAEKQKQAVIVTHLHKEMVDAPTAVSHIVNKIVGAPKAVSHIKHT